MSNQAIEPIINIKNKFYTVCRLAFNLEKAEFFYHFQYHKDISKQCWNETLKQKTGYPDHISFHNNGRVHLTLKKKSNKINPLNAPDNTFLPFEENTITPLLIHSIYQINGDYCLPEVNNSKIGSMNKLPYDNSDFSVILFLVPGNRPMGDFLKDFWLDVKFEQHSTRVPGIELGNVAGRILAWKGWAIDYIISDLVLAPKAVSFQYFHAFAYYDLDLVFKDLLLYRLIKVNV